MKFLPIALAIAFAGCFTPATDIVQTPSGTWTKRECLTVMVSNIRHNLGDDGSNVQAIVTPYVPKVVKAIVRMWQLEDSTDDDTTRASLDLLLKSGAGLYVDWENDGKLANARGNYYRHPRELDSLLFLVMLKNRSWPCNVPLQNVEILPGVYSSQPIARFSDWPCHTPGINDLDRTMFLVNAAGDTLRPKFLWGRNNELLTMEEHIFAMFDFTGGRNRPFLDGDGAVRMVFSGFDPPIALSFPLADP